MKHLKYFNYVIKHKWFVLVAGLRLGRVNLWQLIIHDWHKFLPDEWLPYVIYFYGSGKEAHEIKSRFDVAWNAHQNRAKHHYQYWHLWNDDGEKYHLPMPEKYVREMVADWMGAGRAITGKWEMEAWFLDTHHKKDMCCHTWLILGDMFEELKMTEASRRAYETGIHVQHNIGW